MMQEGILFVVLSLLADVWPYVVCRAPNNQKVLLRAVRFSVAPENLLHNPIAWNHVVGSRPDPFRPTSFLHDGEDKGHTYHDIETFDGNNRNTKHQLFARLNEIYRQSNSEEKDNLPMKDFKHRENSSDLNNINNDKQQTGSENPLNANATTPDILSNKNKTINDLNHELRIRLSNDSESIGKIVGGTHSEPATWPWSVSIQYLGSDFMWYHFCGGSLVHSHWIITAAHCVSQLEDYTVRIVLGEYQLSHLSLHEQVVNPVRMYMHGFFDTNTYLYDIAMVKLERDAMMTSYVQLVEQISPKQDTANNHDNCFIAGWGNTVGTVNESFYSDYLQQSEMTVLSHTECRVYNYVVSDSQLCIFSHVASACSGDSGGPLVCAVGHEWKLTGIASYIGSSTCAPSYPNVYTRSSFYADWFRAVINTK